MHKKEAIGADRMMAEINARLCRRPAGSAKYVLCHEMRSFTRYQQEQDQVNMKERTDRNIV